MAQHEHFGRLSATLAAIAGRLSATTTPTPTTTSSSASIDVRVRFKGGDDFQLALALDPRSTLAPRLLAQVSAHSGIPTGRMKLMGKRVWKGALKHGVDLASILDARPQKRLVVMCLGTPASAAELFAALIDRIATKLTQPLPPRPRTARDFSLGWGDDWLLETRRLAPALNAALTETAADVASDLTRFSAEQLLYAIEMGLRESGDFRMQQTQKDAWMPISVHTWICEYLPRGHRARLLRRCMVLSRRWNRAAGQRMLWRSVLRTGWGLSRSSVPGTEDRLDALFPQALLKQAGSLDTFVVHKEGESEDTAKQRAIDEQRWSQDFANIYLLARRSCGPRPSMLGTLHAVFVAAIYRRLFHNGGSGDAPDCFVELSFAPRFAAAVERAGGGRERSSALCTTLRLDPDLPVTGGKARGGVDGVPLVTLRFVPDRERRRYSTAAFATPSENIVPLEGRGRLTSLSCSRVAFVVDDAEQRRARRDVEARAASSSSTSPSSAAAAAATFDPLVEGASVLYTRPIFQERAVSELVALTRGALSRSAAIALLARTSGDVAESVNIFFRESGVVGGGAAAGGGTAPPVRHWSCPICPAIYGPGFDASFAEERCIVCGEGERASALHQPLSQRALDLIARAQPEMEEMEDEEGTGEKGTGETEKAVPLPTERVPATIVAVHPDAGELYYTIELGAAGRGDLSERRTAVQTVASRLEAVAAAGDGAAGSEIFLPGAALAAHGGGPQILCTAHTFVASDISARIRGEQQRLAPLRRSATKATTAEATHFVVKDEAGRHRSAAALDLISAECIATPFAAQLLPSSVAAVASLGEVVTPWEIEVRARFSDALASMQSALREDRSGSCTLSAVDHVLISAPGPHLFGAFCSSLGCPVCVCVCSSPRSPSLPPTSLS